MSACVDNDLRDRIHSSAESNFKHDVRLVHLDFDPEEKKSLWSPQLTEVQFQGVI